MKEYEIFKKEAEACRPGVYSWRRTNLEVHTHCEEQAVEFASVFHDTHPDNIKAEEV